MFTAKDGSQGHRAMLWGALSFNFGKNAPHMRGYFASTDRMTRVVEQEAIDVILL